MKLPKPKLVGFFPKLPCPKANGIKNKIIKEICSVSDCISTGPENWMDEWKHNTDFWFFDTEELARQIIKKDIDKYYLYAYKLYPLKFDKNGVTPYNIKPKAHGKIVLYLFIGFDIVSRSGGTNFECSPLSCNYGFEKYVVNQYCLIDKLDGAYKICCEIAKEDGWEPGPYYLFEVYRKKIG
jgi:hypothetical protein